MCFCSEYKEADNLLYILMECGELDFDKYLKDTIKQEGHLSPLYIKFYWQSMLQAVGALHKEGQWGLSDVFYWGSGGGGLDQMLQVIKLQVSSDWLCNKTCDKELAFEHV